MLKTLRTVVEGGRIQIGSSALPFCFKKQKKSSVPPVCSPLPFFVFVVVWVWARLDAIPQETQRQKLRIQFGLRVFLHFLGFIVSNTTSYSLDIYTSLRIN